MGSLELRGAAKAYGETHALRGLDLMVASFVGTPAINLLRCAVAGDRLLAGTLEVTLDDGQARLAGGHGEVLLGVRPGDLLPSRGAGPCRSKSPPSKISAPKTSSWCPWAARSCALPPRPALIAAASRQLPSQSCRFSTTGLDGVAGGILKTYVASGLVPGICMAASFEPFGREHVAALLSIAAGAGGIPLLIRSVRSQPLARAGAVALGLSLILVEAAAICWYGFVEGSGWHGLLPLDLCDLEAFAAATVLFKRSRFFFEISYFWGFGGTLQALLTPDLQSPFPSPGFWFFFLLHGLVIIGVAYAAVVFGMRPYPSSILRAFFATAAVAAIAAPVDWILGANYLYLRAKPASASLMDFLGPWPWYIFALVPVCMGFLCLCYAPYWLADRWRKRLGRPGR